MTELCETLIRLYKSRCDADYDVALSLRKQDATEAYERARKFQDTMSTKPNTSELDALIEH